MRLNSQIVERVRGKEDVTKELKKVELMDCFAGKVMNSQWSTFGAVHYHKIKFIFL